MGHDCRTTEELKEDNNRQRLKEARCEARNRLGGYSCAFFTVDEIYLIGRYNPYNSDENTEQRMKAIAKRVGMKWPN